MTLHALAPGKVNLCLLLGGTREDGLHELVSVIEPLSLADELTLEIPHPARPALAAAAPGAGDMGCAAGEDEVVCAGVDGPNLAGTALALFRAASGWEGPPLRLTIAKRVPVAAGMGGGSGDAAAALRLIAHAAGRPSDDPLLARLAPGLGADVPSQVAPGPVLVLGAGEEVRPLPPLPPHGMLVLPSPHALATPDVFREADRLGLPRDAEQLAARRGEVEAALARGELPSPVNDLEPAARSLCPSIGDALAAARAAGAGDALVSGSGPTVVGLFRGADGPARAAAAAERLRPRFPGAVGARPVDAAFAAVRGVWHDDPVA